MNASELRTALDDLAGPPPPATPTARAAVRGRVRRARRRAGAVTVVVSLVAVLLGVGAVQAFAGGGDEQRVATTVPADGCTKIPAAVARSRVPAVVSSWASGRPVVGQDSLWTTRRLLRAGFIHDSGVYRFKFGWLVVPYTPGTSPPTLTARRLDAPGRAVGDANAATDEHGTWFASTIELPSTGCWRITARHGNDTIRVTRRIA